MLFKPTGTLDIASSSSEAKGNMTRSKNLKYEQNAIAITRHGSSRPTSNVLMKPSNFLIEMAGDRFAFAGTEVYRNESNIPQSSLVSTLTEADWDGCVYNAFNDTTERVFATNGTDRVKIAGNNMTEWGVAAPTVAPTITTGTSTGLTGSYNAKYTYLVKDGTTVIAESNPSPDATSAQSLSNQKLRVSWTASSDPQVTHVRVYRTVASGLVYFVDQDIAIGTVTVDTNTADTALGVPAPDDHDRPPTGISVVTPPLFGGIIFMAKDNLLYFSKTKEPEYVPSLNFIEVGSISFPIKALVNFNGQLHALTAEQIYLIQGTVAGSFIAVPMAALTGAPNKYGAVGVKGKGIYHVGADGIYLFTGTDSKITERTYEPIFPDAGGLEGIETNGVQGVPTVKTSFWIKQFQNKVYFHYSNGNVIVFNTDSLRSYYYKYDRALTSPAVDYTNDRFICGDFANTIRVIEDPTVTTDVGNNIDWEIQSEDYTLQTEKHFPKWVKYDIDVSDASSVTGSLVVDNSVHHIHDITASRKNKRRLVDTTNGNRIAVRLNGTGKASIFAAEIA